MPDARDIEARDDAAIILPLSLAQSARKFDARVERTALAVADALGVDRAEYVRACRAAAQEGA